MQTRKPIDSDTLAVVVGLRFAGDLFRAESKARTGKATPAQERELERLRKINSILDEACGLKARAFHADSDDSPL